MANPIPGFFGLNGKKKGKVPRKFPPLFSKATLSPALVEKTFSTKGRKGVPKKSLIPVKPNKFLKPWLGPRNNPPGPKVIPAFPPGVSTQT